MQPLLWVFWPEIQLLKVRVTCIVYIRATAPRSLIIVCMAACWEMLFSNEHPSSLPLITSFVYVEEPVFLMDVFERKFCSQDSRENGVILFSLINESVHGGAETVCEKCCVVGIVSY